MGITDRNYTPRAIFRQVEAQGHLCAYCLLPFGTITRHRGHNVTQKPHGDHFVPHSYGQTTRLANLVAACQVCNWIKSDRMFEDLNEAQRWILRARESRTYRVVFVPRTPITVDSWAWAAEYARFLID